MTKQFLKRTTFIVHDAESSANFYEKVFGWKIWYRNELEADYRFPPSKAEDKARVKLIILDSADAITGRLGFLEYLDHTLSGHKPESRDHVRMGEPILVVQTENVVGIYEAARNEGATIVTEPVTWVVPGAGTDEKIELKSISLFDPNGIYMDISEQNEIEK